MPAFQFRLQRLLEWQERVYRSEEEQMRLCLAAVAETEEQQARLAASRVAVEQEFFGRPTFTVAELKSLAEFRRGSIIAGRKLAEERARRLQLLEDQKQKLLAEKHKLNALEKLRQRALGEYTAAEAKQTEALGMESYLSNWVVARQ